MRQPVVWITGFPGSGKSTLAAKIKGFLPNCIIVDGDEIRRILPGLGYSLRDRIKNAVRICLIVEELNRAGYTVVCATVSLFDVIHRLNRVLFENYLEVYLSCDIEKLKQRRPHVYETLQTSIYQEPANPHLKMESFTERDVVRLCGIIQNLRQLTTIGQDTPNH